MLLICIRQFGNFWPGAEVEVPAGAIFDHYYFELVEAPEAPAPEETD